MHTILKCKFTAKNLSNEYVHKDTEIFRYNEARDLICGREKLDMIYKSVNSVKWSVSHNVQNGVCRVIRMRDRSLSTRMHTKEPLFNLKKHSVEEYG